jgi:hypothetical protein
MISEAYAPRGSKGLEVGRVCARPKACQVSRMAASGPEDPQF